MAEKCACPLGARPFWKSRVNSISGPPDSSSPWTNHIAEHRVRRTTATNLLCHGGPWIELRDDRTGGEQFQAHSRVVAFKTKDPCHYDRSLALATSSNVIFRGFSFFAATS